MTVRIVCHTLVIATVLSAVGAAYGYLTDRWNLNADQLAKMQSLVSVQPALGDWSSEDVPVDESVLPGVRTFCRKYTQAGTNRTVMTTVAVGRPGKVSTHTPDFCFPGSGLELTGDVEKQAIPLGETGFSEFYTAVFSRKRASGTEALRVRWTWTTDGRWAAPDFPRLAFAREPVLLKLYLVNAVPAEGPETDARAYDDFAARFVQELNGRLFAAR
jgi:Protein of unknown function (DUF3485)